MKADINRNLRLGWCHCGCEYGPDCACSEVRKLLLAWGLREPDIERHTEPDHGPLFDQDLSTYDTSVDLRQDQ